MLPPKLSQIMINLSGGDVIYDPFVGLGTVLIEAVN
jgi:tRNA G10  N-methylase Trm11